MATQHLHAGIAGRPVAVADLDAQLVVDERRVHVAGRLLHHHLLGMATDMS